MKKDTFYTLRKQSPWLTVSGAAMGVAFLIHAVYYLLVRSVVQVHMAELIIFMIAPMAVELLWCLLLHVFPLKTTRSLGVLSCFAFLLLLTHALFYNDILRTIMDTAIFLAVAQLVLLILSGRFPYRLFGSAALLAVLVSRVLMFTYPGYIVNGQWEMLITREIPGLCILLAMFCLFGAITPNKKETVQQYRKLFFRDEEEPEEEAEPEVEAETAITPIVEIEQVSEAEVEEEPEPVPEAEIEEESEPIPEAEVEEESEPAPEAEIEEEPEPVSEAEAGEEPEPLPEAETQEEAESMAEEEIVAAAMISAEETDNT